MSENPNERSYEYDVNVIKAQISMGQLLRHFNVDYPVGKAQITIKSLWREEKTPSLSIHLEKNIWRDGGQVYTDPHSGRKIPGNVIGFTQLMRSCSFFEALKYLSETFGITSQPRDEKESGVYKSRQQILGVTESESFLLSPNKIYGKEYHSRHLQVEGLRYFEEKGITAETVRRFKCGRLKDYLKKSRFVGRIVFPIYNKNNELVQYGSRSADDSEPRFNFYPDFHTSLELFNIQRLIHDPEVRKVVQSYGIILVEGFSDAMKLDQLGYPNVVASLGCSLSETQAKLIMDVETNPRGAVKLFYDRTNVQSLEAQDRAVALLYRDGWVRGVDWSLAQGQTEPEHFGEGDKALLNRMLRQEAVW